MRVNCKNNKYSCTPNYKACADVVINYIGLVALLLKMENKLLLDDVSSTLRERVFFTARDGMSLTLYALLYEKSTDEIDDLLNSVSTSY